MNSAQRANQWLTMLVEEAKRHPRGRLELRDADGVVRATLHAHMVPTRPKDMPRRLRPKHKLSKRQRTAAKLAKLREKQLA